MGSIGPLEVLVVLVVALLVLGPEKLPGAARTLGRAIGEVRRYTTGFQNEMRDAFADPKSPTGGASTGAASTGEAPTSGASTGEAPTSGASTGEAPTSGASTGEAPTSGASTGEGATVTEAPAKRDNGDDPSS
ncbi:MAG: twin-arginine translocase TatA/TatE family subunit [Actinomycetota bacterium]|nr:twin-arginine translocase TatA/TatE family subunit [Actinomycetota bacterium]